MQRVVNCRLVISSEINDKKDCVIINGKGYYKNDSDGVVVYFNSEDTKYKYVYVNDCLTIYCNDSVYVFKINSEQVGKIKNGEYVFEIATFATRIEFNDNSIVLDYNLSQQGYMIGKYNTELSFD